MRNNIEDIKITELEELLKNIPTVEEERKILEKLHQENVKKVNNEFKELIKKDEENNIKMQLKDVPVYINLDKEEKKEDFILEKISEELKKSMIEENCGININPEDALSEEIAREIKANESINKLGILFKKDREIEAYHTFNSTTLNFTRNIENITNLIYEYPIDDTFEDLNKIYDIAIMYLKLITSENYDKDDNINHTIINRLVLDMKEITDKYIDKQKLGR